MATTYTLGKSVPSNAVFTDTNTWRGIQDNLTSTATDQSLSANQGKVLKGLVDGKAASGHTHDDRYYTESEINTKLNGKSNTGHTHGASDITSGTLALARGGTGATTALDAYRILSDRGYVSAAADWNTLTAGVWVVAQDKWTANKNQPEGAYSYGNVIVTNNGSNISQIYIAHCQGQLWFRERFGSDNVFVPWECVSVSGHTHTKSQITDFPTSLPASDVYAWAKASAKPSYSWNEISSKPSTFTPASHTHNYAGSASAGGSANSAVKLDTTTSGSATQPVYFSGGKPVACTYTLGKSVPSNAVFTDTHTLTLADRVSGKVVTCDAIPTT